MNSEKPRIQIFDSTHLLSRFAAEQFQEEAKRAESEGQLLHVALSGGSTPRGMFKELSRPKSRLGIPWSSVHIYWADERCVPQADRESNFGNAWDLFLKYVPVPRQNVHRIPGEEEPERACRLYSAMLQQHLPKNSNGLPSFDWIFLGVGKDGHTASLFPGQPLAAETPCLAVEHPETGQPRISLSLPVIQAAKRVTFLVSGADKAAVVAKILNGNAENFPAGQISGPQVEWWCDSEAASKLAKA